jgi:HNH endonuclease
MRIDVEVQYRPMPKQLPPKKVPDAGRLDRIVAQARRAREERERGYREQALKMMPWVCGRCAREFEAKRLRELTVHHRDGNHDNNPPDGSNWELLCVYCHENEHARITDAAAGGGGPASGVAGEVAPATSKALQGLGELLRKKPR